MRSHENIFNRPILLVVFFIVVVGTISSCAMENKESVTVHQAKVDLDLLQTLPREKISYDLSVKPIMDRRCVVCHGCYDAPCQAKLSSPEGIKRGGSKETVYDGSRFSTLAPSRLFIDAKTTDEWRQKGFHALLNEGSTDPEKQLDQSVLYRMLRLKQINPQPRIGMLPDSFDIALNRDQVCPTLDEFDQFEKDHPLWGMPYGMPNLRDTEYRTLVQWLAQGATMPADKGPSAQVEGQLMRWDEFLNGSTDKEKLMSRYLYEHLFQGHLHFRDTDNREFYRLVRSRTPSGNAVDEIETVRPYGDPGGEFYYRLTRFQPSIVAKDHVVYELSDNRMQRYRELFLEPDYPIHELPSYQPKVASNPFKAFAAIPPKSRYLFLLDDSRFFIEGFTKGPVCRGQIALNVIEDRFWVVFFDPNADTLGKDADFLQSMSDYLEIPSAQEDEVGLLSLWTDYRSRERRYIQAQADQFSKMRNIDINDAVNYYIWDGNGSNPNAALTIFRHFDSASVGYGLVGDYPETAWVIGYPMLERIHYLLVAGFNVFGNLEHQLNTRLYMDFLRMEGEDTFLAFLPASHRKKIRDRWYIGMRQGLEEEIDETDETEDWLSKDVAVGYQTDDPQREFYQYLEHRVAKVTAGGDTLNRCNSGACVQPGASADKQMADKAMQKIAKIEGDTLRAFPELTFIRVRSGQAHEKDFAYTVIRDKAYKNVTSMFQDDEDTDARDYGNDALTVVDWLEGSYPNFFLKVDLDQVDKFAEGYAAIKNRDDYERFISLYGLRRTNTAFWDTADWFQDRFAWEKPVLSGLFDLNRYRNR